MHPALIRAIAIEHVKDMQVEAAQRRRTRRSRHSRRRIAQAAQQEANRQQAPCLDCA